MKLKKYKVKATHTWEVDFIVDLDHPETIDIIKSFNGTIASGSDIEDVLKHIVFNYFVNNLLFVEGVGDLSEVEKKKAIVIGEVEDDSDYEIEEVN